MATTTNYGWTTPNDTDLVKDGAAAIRTLGSSVDTTTKNLNPETTLGDISFRSATSNVNTKLAIGSSGQVLTVAAGVPSWATSDDANAIQNAIVDAKGDIVAASAADTPARLAVGTDNYRLIAASAETTGLKYVADTQNTVIDAAGDLVYGTAADTLGRLAIGTAGQVLKVNSGATAPEWGAAGGASGLTLVQRSTFSNVAGTTTTFDGVFTSTYKSYMVVVENISGGTQGDNFELQFIYSGTTQITDYKMTNPYSKHNSSTMSFLNTAAGTSFSIANNIGSATYPTKAQFFINGVGSGSSNYANIRGQVADLIGDEFYIPNGYTEVARAYTGILFKSSSSNVSGTVAVYGLAA